MKIVIATGIYPPEIGGTATYAHQLAQEVRAKGHTVSVITYGTSTSQQFIVDHDTVYVSRQGSPVVRWRRYANALREHAHDADAVIALSSISVGIPLKMAKLTKPKKILRLGGDFFWERYTDGGGRKTLRAWHESLFGFWRLLDALFMPGLLRSFDILVYSTAMQLDLHHARYRTLPKSTIIENAIPRGTPVKHDLHAPMRILCMSRFVGFKNLDALIEAMKELPDARLTMVGSGPLKSSLIECAKHNSVEIDWRGVVSDRLQDLCMEHDLLVIPSVTEISPNAALEARSHGLPVLLSAETGLSPSLAQGMVVRPLRTASDIAGAVHDIRMSYDRVAAEAAAPVAQRDWSHVADEWITLLSS